MNGLHKSNIRDFSVMPTVLGGDVSVHIDLHKTTWCDGNASLPSSEIG